VTAKQDRVQQLRNSIAEIVEEFIPASDARRVMSDVDDLVKMIRDLKQTPHSGVEFS
jgi:hypothetical protein